MRSTIARHVRSRFHKRRSVLLKIAFTFFAVAVASYCGFIAGSGLFQGEVRIFGGGLHETFQWGDNSPAFVFMMILWSGTGLLFSHMALSKN